MLCDLIFLQFDTKRFNRGINYSSKIRNLQYGHIQINTISGSSLVLGWFVPSLVKLN